MNSAWDFIKAKRKLLLCLAVLLGFTLCLVLLLTSRRTPFQAFVIATNELSGVQWMQVVISNSSSKAYSIFPVIQVMLEEDWVQSSIQHCELQPPGPKFGLGDDNIPAGTTLKYRIAVPSESVRWRLKFFCIRAPSRLEKGFARWCRKLGLRRLFTEFDEHGVSSEHTFEFGK